jgi:Asp-tRNA(Asn)/Glu-tRNA(Gln) amidotransferase A subunit family amidase
MGYVPRKFRRPIQGLSLRTQPIKDEEIEDEVEEVIEQAIEEVESLEAQAPDIRVPGQRIAKLASERLLKRQDIVRRTRKAEKVSQRLAEAQLRARINELVRQRREFFESEDEDMEAILFILSELI